MSKPTNLKQGGNLMLNKFCNTEISCELLPSEISGSETLKKTQRVSDIDNYIISKLLINKFKELIIE